MHRRQAQTVIAAVFMTRSLFDPSFEDLPRILPVFPLTGVLLLPGGQLPLNVFEPRYLNMVREALSTETRMIGMIQPVEPNPLDNRGPELEPQGADMESAVEPEIYRIGCAGRIISFGETDDGRYHIALSGICRFRVVEELALKDGFRRVMADYDSYRRDLWQDEEAEIDREHLLETMRAYLTLREIDVDWQAVETTPDDRLVNSLAMSCPLGPSERQALLEAPDLAERARIMITLLQMSLLSEDRGEDHAEH
jgi:Lon protease-like protein